MNNKKQLTPVSATTILSSNLDEIIASTERTNSEWRPTSLGTLEKLPNEAGVYCVVFPMTMLPEKRMVILHGRTSGKRGARWQLQFEFKYEATPFRKGEGVVLYVGKASGLRTRLKGHLSVNANATTNQVLRGLTGQSSHQVGRGDLSEARKFLLERGRAFYYVHQHEDEVGPNPAKDGQRGMSYVADRDLLEIKLIAKYAPPFNIKAER
jgi:hypothetical protein